MYKINAEEYQINNNNKILKIILLKNYNNNTINKGVIKKLNKLQKRIIKHFC